MESSFGKNIKVTIFGGSHEPEIGVHIEGLPADAMEFDEERLQKFLDLRAPGNGPFATKRKEPDKFLVTERTFDDSSETGSITAIIRNTDHRSADYIQLADVPRPGHADLTARYRYGSDLNMAGGGPFSGRMTAPLCIAGGIALQVLEKKGVRIGAHLLTVGIARDRNFDPAAPEIDVIKGVEPGGLPVLEEDAAVEIARVITSVMEEGDSVGGAIEIAATGIPAGAGGAMYDGVESALSQIYFGIPAVKAVEFGAGCQASLMRGSENNDAYCIADNEVRTKTNNAGGILGGITNGMPLIARVWFKPTPSISKEQDSVDLREMKEQTLKIEGRHDPCVAVRAVPVTVAATAIGLLDLLTDKREGRCHTECGAWKAKIAWKREDRNGGYQGDKDTDRRDG